MQTKVIERYFFFGLLLATLVFTFFIFRPFLLVLVLGASFSIVLYPLYEWFTRRKLPGWLSAFLTVLLFILVICGPLFGIGVLVFNQSQDVYQTVEAGSSNIGPFLQSIDDSIQKVLPEGITFDFNEKISEFISLISSNVSKIFTTTVSAFLSVILTFLAIFYFLKDGAEWKKRIIMLSPLSDANDQKIIHRLSQTINGVIKGYLFIALVQGILMGLGLAIFGVPHAALWGVVTAIVSLIPTIGTSLVSIPATLFLFFGGHTMEAAGLLIWAVFLVGMVDNLLSPIVVGSKIKIPAFLILFSVLGGISLLGPVGILIGPLAVSLLYTLLSIYRNEFEQSNVT